MTNVFIIGCKGIPAKYGGFETFVDKLTEYRKCGNIKYHVACMSKNYDEFEYNNARCFNVKVENIGSARAVLYDLKALKCSIKYIKENKLNNSIIYILACRIGPFLGYYKSKLKKYGVKIYVNPDGNEWKRGKWNKLIKFYWKLSEGLMVKKSDLLICDSLSIETYIKNEYRKYSPKTNFIAYGADVNKSLICDGAPEFNNWLNKFKLSRDEYYLVVGRFVPENNYETIINEFMKSETKKNLVIITNIEQNKFFKHLVQSTNYAKDKRIKFVGTVYNKELLKKIRENAFAYIHGHEVGGTNPSLLEALASTHINILFDVCFNREVALDGALYFNKSEGNLSSLINKVEKYDENKISILASKSSNRIKNDYHWDKIIDSYEILLNN